MFWVIRNKTDVNLCWSNVFGWVSENYDIFFSDEKEEYHLPLDGEWIEYN